jgi:hypothetical protein
MNRWYNKHGGYVTADHPLGLAMNICVLHTYIYIYYIIFAVEYLYIYIHLYTVNQLINHIVLYGHSFWCKLGVKLAAPKLQLQLALSDRAA